VPGIVTGVDDELEGWLAGTDPGVAALARRTCALVTDLLPGAIVTVDPDLVGFGTAPGYKGLYFTVAAYRSHVTLGIARGASLPDPAQLMEGKGKVHRHVKIREPGDLERPELRTLLESALAA
jgi:hypothetical protein